MEFSIVVLQDGMEQCMATQPCSGLCNAGFFCTGGSTSPRQFYCGEEDKFCPKGSTEPQYVQEGYYTSTYTEGCRPGFWRNTSLSIDPSLHPAVLDSAISTSTDIPPCNLCEEGTFKYQKGDIHSFCLPCPSSMSVSSGDRKTPEIHSITWCSTLHQGDVNRSTLHVNKRHHTMNTLFLRPNLVKRSSTYASQDSFAKMEQYFHAPKVIMATSPEKRDLFATGNALLDSIVLVPLLGQSHVAVLNCFVQLASPFLYLHRKVSKLITRTETR